MTSARHFRLPGAAALLSLLLSAGCSSPQPSSVTQTPSPAHSSAPLTRSTAPIHVGPVHIVAAPAAPPLSHVIPSPYVIPSGASALRTPYVAPTTKPMRERSRGTAEHVAARATMMPAKLPYVYASPHAPPRILAINISTLNARAGQTVSGSVETTSNVASVEVRIAGWGMSLARPRIGYFEASGVIPDLPPFAKGTYTLQVIARNADGRRAERDFPITLR